MAVTTSVRVLWVREFSRQRIAAVIDEYKDDRTAAD